MHLVSFGVRNYRSITKASKLQLQPSATILIGPNNEGKSNLVGALAVAMTAIRAYGTMPLGITSHRYLWRSRDSVRYRWRQDFPIGLQQTDPKGTSQFDLEFRLTPQEVGDFWKEVKSSLNGTLPIRLMIGETSFKFSVPKKGPGAASLTKKADVIARFVGKRIDFRHIRAIRTATEARSVVEGLVRRELSVLENHPDYQAAVQQIALLQAPILNSLSLSVRDTLKAFLPSVTSVRIAIPPQERYEALTEYWEMIVDDGVPTRLEQKGDGVQSLAALSLMRSASQASAGTRQLILAIEEPESHLHPKAIHQLRRVVADIATQHQTILTTHCPLFVDRGTPQSNIIVVDSRATQATSTRQIRDVLGVRVADNLMHAELSLVVEGNTDRTILTAWLAAHSQKLADAMADNFLVLDPLVGARKLTHRLLSARDAMCGVYCFLDNDAAGRDAVKQAQKDGLLQSNEYTLAARPGQTNSELEDLLEPSITDNCLTSFGVGPLKKPRNAHHKWSDRVEAAFKAAGKLWDDAVMTALKAAVSQQAAASPLVAIAAYNRSAVDALMEALEARLP
jgi:predicted ATPase